MPAARSSTGTRKPARSGCSRVLQQWPNAVWINPVPEKHWGYTHSIGMIRDMFGGRMYPLTLAGLDSATRDLSRKH